MLLFEPLCHYDWDFKASCYGGDGWTYANSVGRKSRDRGPFFQRVWIWIGDGWASRLFIYRGRSVRKNLLSSSKNYCFETLVSSVSAQPFCPFFFSSNRERRRRGRRWWPGFLSFGESGRYITLFIMKRLLRCISRRDIVPPSRATGESPASIKSGTCPGRLWDASAISQASNISCKLQSTCNRCLALAGFLGSWCWGFKINR